MSCVAGDAPSGPRAGDPRPATREGLLNFTGLTINALTPFWAFRLRGRAGKAEQTVEFVLRLPLVGMPEGRAAAIMSSMINSSERFLRYLALLLAEDPTAPGVDMLKRDTQGRGGRK